LNAALQSVVSNTAAAFCTESNGPPLLSWPTTGGVEQSADANINIQGPVDRPPIVTGTSGNTGGMDRSATAATAPVVTAPRV